MDEVTHAKLWGEPGRRRLVRLCAVLTGDRDAAEDLAQETLLEAWRNVHKLHDPTGADRWLAAIARHVCLRWARRRGQDPGVVPVDLECSPGPTADVEVELERAELAELVDRALGLLPPETRDVLIHRYVHDSPHAEIGARLGLSADSVSMRLSRGKAALRRLLGSELRDEAAAYGLLQASDDTWRETRIWCAECARRKLLMRSEAPAGPISFRCPDCNPDAAGSEYALENPFFARLLGGLVRPTAIRARAAEWSSRYFAGGAGSIQAECTRCGCALPLRRYFRDRDGRRSGGLYADCAACGEQVSSSLRGLAVSLPEIRRFGRDHPRSRLLPHRQIDFGGAPAIVVRYEDVLGRSGVDVVFAHDTLRVLRVATG